MRGKPTWVPVLQLPIPGACACGGCFQSVGFSCSRCIFLLFLVQLKFPEGRTKNTIAGQRFLCFFTSQSWDATGLSPLTLEVQDTAGHKSRGRSGGARFSREKERGLCCRYTSTERDLSLPIMEAALCHWTSPPSLGATSVQMKENGSHAERVPPCPMG